MTSNKELRYNGAKVYFENRKIATVKNGWPIKNHPVYPGG